MLAPDPRHTRRSQAETPLIDLSEFGQPPLSAGKVSQAPMLMVDSAMASPNRFSLNWPDNQSGAVEDSTVVSSPARRPPTLRLLSHYKRRTAHFD
jgi:hypothetical protein